MATGRQRLKRQKLVPKDPGKVELGRCLDLGESCLQLHLYLQSSKITSVSMQHEQTLSLLEFSQK